MTHVLVVYGSKMGGTAGLAHMVADALQREGVDVQVSAAAEVRSIDGFDAVVVGGALYAGRWSAEARHFMTRFAGPLRQRPVFLFSSGPLDDSADDGHIPPTRQVQRLMGRVNAMGHATFGGALSADASGIIAHAMAKEHAGDWRDQDVVDAWVHDLVETLAATRRAPAS